MKFWVEVHEDGPGGIKEVLDSFHNALSHLYK